MNELLKRTLSGAVYVFLVISTTVYSPIVFSLLFSFFLIVGSFEFSQLIRMNKYVLATTSVLVYLCISFIGFDFLNLFDSLILFALLTSIYLLIFLFDHRAKISQSNIIKFFTFLGYILVPFLLIIELQSEQKFIMLSIFLLVWCNDTFAYLLGKQFGQVKLFASVSPKKTVEGLIGGMIITAMVAALLSKYMEIQNMNFALWVVFGLIVSIFGTLGDLVQSKLKRIAGVKDSGTIMPGHGGILDRLDSVIFIIPWMFLFIKIVNYVS